MNKVSEKREHEIMQIVDCVLAVETGASREALRIIAMLPDAEINVIIKRWHQSRKHFGVIGKLKIKEKRKK